MLNILISPFCPQNDATPGSGVDHPFPDRAFKSLFWAEAYVLIAKTDCVLNMGSFVSRLVSCLISKVVHGYMVIAKEIR